MEFFCVLSVSGSLASYQVNQETEGAYKAVLRTGIVRRDDIPAEISLQRKEEKWQAEPWHDEIVKSLIHAIESNGH
jgi:hypothetical protein